MEEVMKMKLIAYKSYFLILKTQEKKLLANDNLEKKCIDINLKNCLSSFSSPRFKTNCESHRQQMQRFCFSTNSNCKQPECKTLEHNLNDEHTSEMCYICFPVILMIHRRMLILNGDDEMTEKMFEVSECSRQT